jgi:hypothetical protein
MICHVTLAKNSCLFCQPNLTDALSSILFDSTLTLPLQHVALQCTGRFATGRLVTGRFVVVPLIATPCQYLRQRNLVITTLSALPCQQSLNMHYIVNTTPGQNHPSVLTMSLLPCMPYLHQPNLALSANLTLSIILSLFYILILL